MHGRQLGGQGHLSSLVRLAADFNGNPQTFALGRAREWNGPDATMMEGLFVLLTGLVGALVIRHPHQALVALLIVALKLWLSSSFEVEVIYSAWASILLCILSSRLLHWGMGLVLIAAQVNFLVRTWDTLDCTGLSDQMWWAGLAALLVSVVCVGALRSPGRSR